MKMLISNILIGSGLLTIVGAFCLMLFGVFIVFADVENAENIEVMATSFGNTLYYLGIVFLILGLIAALFGLVIKTKIVNR